MHISSFSLLAFLLPFVACATDASAVNLQVKASKMPLKGNGKYIITHVKTGKRLSFVRNEVTNLYPVAKGTAVEIQIKDNLVRISGQGKCASAQWDATKNGGANHAMVSYACAVGSGQSGTKTLEKSKQWWYLVKHVGEVGKRSRVFEESFVDERALTEMYYIIAFDHIGDQSPKAATGASLITAGGYRSTVLSVWNKKSNDQLWTIKKV